MSNSIFNIELINQRLKELQVSSKFTPQKGELKFTATQFFEDTGIEATIYFVMRNGEMIIYDYSQKRIQ